MTQMESPKRKMQKRNDYQRHKLFRKIKRRRKAQAEAEQQIAEKQLRKKLKLPKFDRGEDELSTYKKQVEMFNDANSDPRLPGRLVDRNRVTVNPETGDVMEVGGHVKPSRRGTFTKAAKQHGMSVQSFANKVLRNPSKYSAAMRKKANFAHNASKWNK